MPPRIAINVCDLDALTPRNGAFNPIALLLKDFCSKDSPTVMPNRDRWDSAAIVLDGPAAQARSASTPWWSYCRPSWDRARSTDVSAAIGRAPVVGGPRSSPKEAGE